MNTIIRLFAVGASALAISSAAAAADLIIDTPVEAGVVEASGNWDGAFIGVFGGYAWGELGAEGAPPGSEFPEPAGWLLGVNAGANFTLDNGIVLGVVGDIAWADITDTLTQPGFGSFTSAIDWQGSLRGRIGFDGGAFLPYLTAGLAVAHNNVDVALLAPPTAFGDDATHVGWTVGAGVEFAATEELSIDVAYRYSDYGDADYTLGLITNSLDLTTHQVTVGLNWGF